MNRPTVLVINCGSSSLKFALIEPVSGALLRRGLAERLATEQAQLELRKGDEPAIKEQIPGAAHGEALERILKWLGDENVAAVGHRVVQGGEIFSQSVRLDDAAIKSIEDCAAYAPLHNPAHVIGMRAARACFPTLPHVAVFDTAFHQTMPPKAYRYAIPDELYARFKVRRYGAHGTSHWYVAREAARRLDRPVEELELITAHLGNGCSATAVRGGKSVDTTMGLTPLEGLVMGTRSGDVDPNLHQFLADQAGLSLREITDMLNRKSGLLGLSGTSNDMRAVLSAAEKGDARAELAVDVFCYRLARHLLGLCAALTRVDGIVFTGGIGEHSAPIRARTLEQLAVLGAKLDPALNARHGADANGRISSPDSRVLALVVPTNEELVIAREAQRFVEL